MERKYFTSLSSCNSWTPTAISCYEIGCQCSKCHVLDNLELTSNQCRMKAAVIELVRRFGAPNLRENMEEQTK